MTRFRVLVALCAALITDCFALARPSYAFDMNGSWATDASVCNKIFANRDGVISFRQDSDQYGGGFVVDGDKVHGQQQSCTVKARKEDGQVVHILAYCASGIMLSNVQLSVKVIDANTIERYFPGMGDELSMKYSRCPKDK